MAFSADKTRLRQRIDVDSLSLPIGEPDDDATVLEDETVVDEAALKSFILEVSARRPRGVGDATDTVSSGISAPVSTAREHVRPRTVQRHLALPLSSQPEIIVADVDRVSAQGSDIATNEFSTPSPSPAPRTNGRAPRRRVLPAWMASAGVHLAVVSLLATVSIATIEQAEELELWLSPPDAEELSFDDVVVESVADEGEMLTSEPPTELIDPGQAAFGGMSTDLALGAVAGTSSVEGTTGVPGGGGPLGEIGGLFGNGGAGIAKFDSGLGGAPTAKFFGQEIEGRRIVFVLDNSGSMQGGRLETVISELLRCVDSLRNDQEFYVIFHSDMVYPMFFPDPVDRYVRPTKANKRMLARWLDTVELCLGDSVDEAIAIAAMIEPDTVFLLSDGRIQSQKTIRFLLAGESRNFPIHTFAVGMGGSVAGRRNLADVAAANGGEFSESEIPAEMRDLARREMRPYHSEQPGPVWGRRVKPFRPRG